MHQFHTHANLSARNIETMLYGTGLATLLISGILIFALRSVRLGLVSLVPNFVPAIMGFGLWGYLVGEIGVAVAVMGHQDFQRERIERVDLELGSALETLDDLPLFNGRIEIVFLGTLRTLPHRWSTLRL